METSAATPRGGAVRRRIAVVAGATLLLVAVVSSSLTAAASPSAGTGPIYTDWTAPVSLGPVVNSAFSDTGPALSPDGLSLYLDSQRPGGLGGTDIWVSQRASVNDPWGAPVNLGPTINSASLDNIPSFSHDGHWLFFTSDRPGGFGGQDLYGSYRADVHDDFGWQPPENLGPGVNGPVNDVATGYLENAGVPQLIFGSNRLGGEPRHMFLSTRQDDGTWGPAELIPELVSSATDNGPSVRHDGREIFFFSTRPGGFGAADVWTATRASVDASWSTPVNLGPTVNTSSNDGLLSLSADGRVLVVASTRPGGSGSFDLWMATRAAKLAVTANDQSRLFGQANPPLTDELTGFVGGETSAVVSGTAACSTTAMPASPAGDYPITCTAGSLSAPGYVFDSFVAGTLTVSYSRPCLAGPGAGPLHVAAGEAVCVGAGGSQTGPVTVAPGGSLDVEGGRITGPVVASGAAVVRICGATITGPLTITGTGPVVVGGEGCDPNTVAGPVRVTGNTGGVEVSGNTVVGLLRVTGNAAPVDAHGNTVTGPVAIQT
jgi:hypothetical protein